MDWEYDLLDDEILMIRSYGDFSSYDLLNMVKEIFGDNKWKPDKSIILDFRKLNLDNVKIEDIYSSVFIHSQYNDVIGGGKIAAIHQDYPGFGLSELYEGVASRYIKTRYATFRNVDNALEWIHESSDS